MRSSSTRIDITASSQRVEVDQRLSLRIYYRIADSILRQAAIFRNEKNIIDLYVMLLRYSSLVSETIPRHRDYAASAQIKKSFLRKQLYDALNELEDLKSVVKQKVEELQKKPAKQALVLNQNNHHNHHHSQRDSVEWPPVTGHSLTNNQVAKYSSRHSYGGLNTEQKVQPVPLEERFHRLSVTTTRPKEETLLRHSILGPNGLCAKWQPPASNIGVRYPSNIDQTPVEIPRLHQVAADVDEVVVKKDNITSDYESPSLEAVPVLENDSQKLQDSELPMISFDATDVGDTVIVKEPFPPAALTEVQDLVVPVEQSPVITENQDLVDSSLMGSLLQPESPMELHISTSMMDTFMRLAKSNTAKNLETCGILAGSLKNRKFYITALIIPKQESTSNSCQATNEEEIFDVQDKRSLFPLGWIHTHPTQSCFMSSIDVHTHYSYQVMLPEAVAIVMAPTDRSKNHGIFRLTTPGGMSVIRHCDRRGFHSHDPPADGGPIYKQCTDVYMNPKLKFDVIDLR
ncbi:hypothetical protein RND81_06G071500 [Saponaria officinalis]|uniref:MPN domain-containing protein n=1 Tax=Saponaria officinalis TaxID=3572 RepID=A0AAW1K8A6_SAPOF